MNKKDLRRLAEKLELALNDPECPQDADGQVFATLSGEYLVLTVQEVQHLRYLVQESLNHSTVQERVVKGLETALDGCADHRPRIGFSHHDDGEPTEDTPYVVPAKTWTRSPTIHRRTR